MDQEADGLSATAQLNVTVLDYNDNAPQFPVIPEPLQIPEGNYSEESPREIFTIKPTDVDLGLNGQVIVSLLSPPPLFRITEVRTVQVSPQVTVRRRRPHSLCVVVLCCRTARYWLSDHWTGRAGKNTSCW